MLRDVDIFGVIDELWGVIERQAGGDEALDLDHAIICVNGGAIFIEI